MTFVRRKLTQTQTPVWQVSNWFANARRRLKNTVKQPDLTWASRIKLYNSCVEGNAELFSIGSDDSCPESDDDMMGKADLSELKKENIGLR